MMAELEPPTSALTVLVSLFLALPSSPGAVLEVKMEFRNQELKDVRAVDRIGGRLSE